MKTLTTLLILLATLLGPQASGSELANHHTVKWTGPKAGHSLFYTDNSFARIGRVRVRQGYISHVRKDVAGFVAVTDCSKVGWIALVSLNGRPAERMQILDCSQPYHAKAHVKARRVAEVDKSSFVRNGCNPKRGRCPAQLVDIRRR